MKQYNVTGMSCAACSTRVEKAVYEVPGVTECSVSLLTNSMGVEGTASEQEIIAAVEKAGYCASLKESADNQDVLNDTETPVLRKRLLRSLVFLIILMYFSMGHTMWNWPLPSLYNGNSIALGVTELVLAAIVIVINRKFFINGFKSLFNGSPNMDTLVALGSGASFVYSTYALISKSGDFYFESSAMILTLITVGKMLEAKSKGRTTNALKTLIKLSPETAVIEENGKEIEIPVQQVKKGDIFIVKPGENIPADGIIIEGDTAVNESALTGESIPVDKSPGDFVSAGTSNTSGFIKCRAENVGENTALAKIIQMVSDAAATKAPIARIADKVSGVFVPAVITVAAITFIAWIIAGKQLGFALSRAVSVLVISCPCALGLATPVAIIVGNGVGARNGILFKTAVALEKTGKIRIAALDKTGTVTSGEPSVTDIVPSEGFLKEDLLSCAYSLEKKSEHPLAGAITDYCNENNVEGLVINNFKVFPGNGLLADLNGVNIAGGSFSYISEKCKISKKMSQTAESFAQEGKTPIFFSEGDKLLGIIAVADVIKDDSLQAVSRLKNMGIRVVMLTGDNERTAKAIGNIAEVDTVVAGVLPDEKETVVRKLKELGEVAMVGDGINDAPALTSADIGIAIGAGSDVAIDAADIVLIKSRLSDVPAAVSLSRATLRNIHENLFWAFFYNVICIPLAAGVYSHLFGWNLNPMIAAASMSLSSFCVVTNSLRLNLVEIKRTKNDRIVKESVSIEDIEAAVKSFKEEKERKKMTKTLNISGMMCCHCEATVKKALEALDGVEKAVVSHETGTAVLTLSSDVKNDMLKIAVEDKDFTVTSIE